ncbi:MAG: anhydro-N-acetylmuramic acid kinase [Alphaproteobacteria bacterium]|nr:anhydro-N-acetylmuramic acid kinase [Alphaproteobacteria bacterium]
MSEKHQSAFYIGIMTGNSMDAVDMVYADITVGYLHPIVFNSIPFSDEMRVLIADLRTQVLKCCCRVEIEALPLFQKVHRLYIEQIADAVVTFIKREKIDMATLNGICFHGKTLDHCPPSRIQKEHLSCRAYTVQMGSGQLLADKIYQLLSDYSDDSVRVIYDFRSDDVMNGGEGAPLIPIFNAFMAKQEGCLNRIDINAGNTSNLCVIKNGKAIGGWDLGPCNAYTDYLVRLHTDLPYDKDGQLAQNGQLNIDLLKELFTICQAFYEAVPPKSGDPAFYFADKIKAFQNKHLLADNLYTTTYTAAYVMAYGLKFILGEIPSEFSLFGGGWNHPLLKQHLWQILTGKGYILLEHQDIFTDILNRLSDKPRLKIHPHQQSMECLLMVLMGWYFDNRMPWTTPVLTRCQTPTVCGRAVCSAKEEMHETKYTDKLSRASQGWN